MLPKGSLLRPPALMTKVYGPLRRTYSFRLPGLVRGSEHSAIIRAMKPQIGVRFAGPDKLVHLIEAGEVVQRLGRGFADLFHRPAQAGADFPDGNQPVSFTLHGLFSHAPETRPREHQPPVRGNVMANLTLEEQPSVQRFGGST